MQIVCPNCKTSYQLAETAIGENGRSVRCVRCQTQWRAMPPAIPALVADEAAAVNAFRSELGAKPLASPASPVDMAAAPATAPDEAPQEPSPDNLAGLPEDAAGAPAEAAPTALSDIPIPVDDAPPLVPTADGDAAAEIDNGPPDIESVAARRARAAARRRQNRWRRILLPVTIAALIAISGGLLGWRKDVVRHIPQLASFYSAIGMPVNLRGLTFTDLKIGNEIHDGVPVLVVEGLIVSMTSTPVDVPRIRFALRNATGAEIYSWTAQPSQPTLGAFETLPFRSRLASPPAEGHDIQVRFFTRRDAVADLR